MPDWSPGHGVSVSVFGLLCPVVPRLTHPIARVWFARLAVCGLGAWFGLGTLSDAPGQSPRRIRTAPPRRVESLPSVATDANIEALPPADASDRFLIERVDPQRSLEIVLGQPTVLRFSVPPFRDQIGDSEIADVLNLTESEISVTGRKVGTTVLNVWFEDPIGDDQEVVSYLVRVVENPEASRQIVRSLDRLESDINRSFLGSVVDLSYVGSQVIVRGKARDVEAATQILRIVSQSIPHDEDQLDPRENAAELADPPAITPIAGGLSPTGFVGVDPSTGLPIAASPFLPSSTLDDNRFLDPVTGANPRDINNRVVNMLEIAGVHQIMLKVTLAEVVRDSSRSLVAESFFGFDDNVIDDVTFAVTNGIGDLTFQSDEFFLRLTALKRLGLARSLSEPNLTTLNGQPATFLVGGQFPVLESISTVTTVNQTVRFVPFGIQLAVLPTVTDGDRVRLQLNATVSELGSGGIGGPPGTGNNNNDDDDDTLTTPPSLTTRNFTSTVELRDGESMAMAGLIRNSLTTSSTRVPFLGDVPVLGNLFSSNSSGFQEQELLVVVTPHLVAPVAAGHHPPLPGSDEFEPDDLDFFLRGQIHGSIADDYRTPVRDGIARMKAFRRCEQKLILGGPGHSSGRPLPAPANDRFVSPATAMVDPNVVHAMPTNEAWPMETPLIDASSLPLSDGLESAPIKGPGEPTSLALPGMER